MNSKRILLGLLMIVCYVAVHAQEQDPFQAYLTGEPPVIAEDLGTETTPEGIRIHRFVFRSREVAGQPSLVFAAIAYPPGKGPFPGIVRLHGGGGSADIPSAISSAKEGYASLVLDVPGVAGAKSRSPKTTGPWLNQPMIGAKPDATGSSLFDAVLASAQCVYLLRAQPDVDRNNICVAGASWGGYTATMVASLVDKDIVATWSVFGSGNFLLGAYTTDQLKKLPEAERKTWEKWLDPGSRAKHITKPYFISTASNDRHWSWMAVQATLADIKGPVNQFFSPNDNHSMTYPGNKNMLNFFDHYVKHNKPLLPKVIAGKTRRLKDGCAEVIFTVKDTTQLTEAKIYYSDAAPRWTERKWIPITAIRDGNKFRSYVPAEIARKHFSWYAIVTDKNETAWGDKNAACSSLIQDIK